MSNADTKRNSVVDSHQQQNSQNGNNQLAPMPPSPKQLRIQAPQPSMNRPSMRKAQEKMPKESPYTKEPDLANKAYNNIRVYHGVHHVGQNSINQHGLNPQGGVGMSDMIGDLNRAQGNIFVTTDKEQAAYYAQVSSLSHKQRLLGAAKSIQNDDAQDAAIEAVFDNPPKPQIMRALLSPNDRQAMIQDEKGADADHMIPHSLSSQQMLKGSNTPNQDMSSKRGGVQLFHNEMQRLGASVSHSRAAHYLEMQRRNSITGDHAQLNSNYAKDGAKSDVNRAVQMGKLPRF